LRLGLVASLLLGLGGLALWSQSRGQAESAPFRPQTAAVFPAANKLVVGVTLTNADARELTGDLQVELVKDQDQTLAKAVQPVRQKERLAGYRFELAADKAKADGLTLRVRLGGQRYEMPLAKVLLTKGHETSLTTSQEFFAGSAAPFRCEVHGVRSERETLPLAAAAVTVRLNDKDGKPRTLYEGKTPADGRIDAEFQVPAVPSGQYTLEVVTKSPLGEDKLQRAVHIKADAKILLLSDKPVYQPGQEMHLRALCLRPFDLRPVENAALLFEIEDGKGNKVFKKTVKTSAFGVASVDFQLADEVNQGDYHLRAEMNGQRAEKTVSVKRYVLPRFKVNVSADKRFYLPKETVKAEIQSDYFFGKTVAGAKVEVTASTFDVAFRQFHKWTGKTDEAGHANLEFQLPDYFVGQPLQKGNALLKLDVKVTDTADHTEAVVKNYTVSDQPIQINLIPEGGRLVPGLDNRVFAAAVYPDGSPAACEVKLWVGKEAKGKPLASVQTNDAGLAEFHLTPKADQLRPGDPEQRTIEMLGGNQVVGGQQILMDVVATAKDRQGSVARAAVQLNAHPMGENVLLRLNKAVYQSADTMDVDVRTSAGLPTAFLDITRGGQIVLSRWLEAKGGQAKYRLDLPPGLFGSMEVHAYQMLSSGEIIRDSRVVYVQPRNDLKVEVKASKDSFKPGENGRIRFVVTDAAGKPTQAALGVIVVDEAVYALQEMQPGLEKVYFTLQEELLKPQVEIKYQPEPLDHLIRLPRLPAPKQQVAEVLMTAVKVQPPARWQVAPDVERRTRFEGQVQQVGWALYRYAWYHDDFMKHDADKERWTFAADLTDLVLKANYLFPQQLNTPLGGKLSVESVARDEKDFDLDHLTAAITQLRMKQLAEGIVKISEAKKDALFKDGRWQLGSVMLIEAARAQGLDDRWLQDAWGQAFKLVKGTTKHANPTGHSQFDYYDIVSAGPDRDFESGDDIRWTASSGRQVSGWWSPDKAEAVARLGQHGGFNPYAQLGQGRDRDLLMLYRNGTNLQRQLREDLAERAGGIPLGAAHQAGLGGRPGVPVPTAAAPDVAKRAETKEAPRDKGAGGPPAQKDGGSAPVTRVREYFPETLLWQPNLVTDERGVADLAINLADSITTWRLSASASSRAGALGGAQAPLKVFQDFFVEPDLPVSLTQNDEVAFPVAVYNYLQTPQTIKLTLQQESWFELLDTQGLTRELKVQPNEVTSVRYRIRAKRIGFQPINVTARGSKMSDAVKRLVEVVPDGQKHETVVSDRLNGKVTQTLTIPQDALEDSAKILVRIYPGVMAQVVDGLDGMMRMPGGCFEQTSSSAYPNILIVDYLKKNKLNSPQTMLKAEQYLNAGYQRLLTFERPGGGFDWWGSGPPLVWLSAYGLQEFNDMAKVWPVDKGIIDRTQAWLMKQRGKDGTWSNIGATHSETIAAMGNPKLLLTSYVTWSLLASGLPKDQLKTSVDYLRGHVKDAGNNPYVLALAANALAAYDAKDDSTLEVVRKLEKLHQDVPDWKAQRYPSGGQSIAFARGDHVTIESTALTAMAMVKTGQFTSGVNKALTFLIKSKDGSGTWGTTSATILSLKALLAGMGGNQVKGRVPFDILVNGKEAARGEVTEENQDVMQAFDLKAMTQAGENTVQIKAAGETGLMYQIVGRCYQPWKKEARPTVKSGFQIEVTYDRTKLSTSDLLHAKATVKYDGALPANMVMVDLGIAPGFTVDAGDFAEMVKAKKINRFSVTSRQVILYLSDLRPGESRTFEYALRARFPLRAQTPVSTAYEYYTPTNRAQTRPVELTVTEGK
jgi:5-hydroxyisourate hydrolase-like protein (transthyretin family)